MNKLSLLRAFVVLSVAFIIPVAAQQPTSSTNNSAKRMDVTSGTKMKVKGTIVKRQDQDIIMRDMSGAELTVRLAGNAKIEERKGNPFRSGKKYGDAQLVRGLFVEVEGRGDSTGVLVADKIKVDDDDLRVALTVDSTVVPIENRIGETEGRLTKTEQNAERLSGQLDELQQVANLAKGGAAAAQETADVAVDGVNRTNDRISSLDDYDVRKTESIMFKVGSAVLSADAKSTLDSLAGEAKNERGFVIEVRGFASSDGSERSNRALSQRRAQAVMGYLAETHNIPLRRIILPFGYGETQPVADNTTLEGRKQNRRVEISVLVSKGLTTPVNVSRPVGSN